ncbi:MAG: 6-carboxytetrahydropterin synthase [Bacteroidia bacterium]|nr:6-carboxytetrahydropterin synthase [Bacteroidia bacterium]
MIYVTRKEHFNAAHKVYRPDWTDEKNQAVFGKCANPNWHGHNYDLFVTVKGMPSAETGFVMDIKQLSNLINDEVIKHIDHKNLNLDVPFLKDKIPSTENLAIAIWQRLFDKIAQHNCTLHAIKLYETERNFVEYFGN